jgi:hypothetical protein
MDQEHLKAVVRLLGGSQAAEVTPARIFIDHNGFASLKLRNGPFVRLGDDKWDKKLRWLPRAIQIIRDKKEIAGYIDITTLQAPVWKPVSPSST